MRPGIPAGRDWDKPPESAPGLPVVYRQPFRRYDGRVRPIGYR